MKMLGIVSEYNPFHKGHLYMLEAASKLAGGDCGIICVMGGNFMQRGEPAVFLKHARAEAAVRCGADLVFELPLPWAISSAEGFARGAVGLLGSLGAVSHIGFGSECGDLEALGVVAEALLDPSIDGAIRIEQSSGLSYPAARQRALEQKIGAMARILEKPNNTLAVEYIKAVYNQRLSIKPVTVRRAGAGHDMTGGGEIRSASELRAALAAGDCIDGHIPKQAADVYSREIRQGRGPVRVENLEVAILSRLRALDESDFNALPDATEGLGSRLCRAATLETLDAILAEAKTKRYTMSRLRRMIMCAALGVKAGMAEETPPYARLLACSEKGRGLLNEIEVKSAVPVITKPAAAKEMSNEIRKLASLEAAATDLYILGFKTHEERRGGRDWRTSPVIVRE